MDKMYTCRRVGAMMIVELHRVLHVQREMTPML